MKGYKAFLSDMTTMHGDNTVYEKCQVTTMTSRKEIAARLREAGEDNNDWSMGANAAFFKIDDIIGAQYKSYGFFFNRLASLIDPTCHDFGGEEGTNGENYDFACSACGWCGDMTKPNYCPNCGARVVRDEA